MRYGTIVADPPWRYQRATSTTPYGRSSKMVAGHYPTMTTDEIAALPVADLAATDAHLYMWVTNPVLTGQYKGIRGEAGPMDISRAWGFEPKTLLTWVKAGPPGMGFYFRGQTEHVVFATRGAAGIPEALRRPNVFTAPRRGHSEKPDSFLDIVEAVSPAPRVELFARRARFGWDYWGDESLGTAAVGA